MSIRVSTEHHVEIPSIQWGSFNSDSDILTGVDTLDAVGVTISIKFKPHSFDGTNFARILLRESDSATSGYTNVHQRDIGGSSSTVQGVLHEQKTTVTNDNDDDALTFTYTGHKRYLVVRFDEQGSLTGVRVGAAVALAKRRETGP